MTKVKIDPGVCGMVCCVSAHSDDGETVALSIEGGCEGMRRLVSALSESELDPYEVCLCKPGTGPVYELAAEHLPSHCACPTLAGIVKCIEVEAKLALPKNASITFE